MSFRQTSQLSFNFWDTNFQIIFLFCNITFNLILVDDGCIIDVNFDHFVFPPPPGFQKLMIEKDLL